MSYCQHCGHEVDAIDMYCDKCGQKLSRQHLRRVQRVSSPAAEKEPFDKLMCELAYTGTLFWLPLLTCSKEKYARYYANQGLWILILSVISCTGIRILASLNEWLSNGIVGIIANGVYSLVFMIFLFTMLFLLWSAITRAKDIHNDNEPRPLLFFEQFSIIKYEEV